MTSQSFTLNAHDYLIQQLFAASQSTRIQKKRKRSWIMLTTIAVVFGALFYMINNKFAAYECFTASIILLFFYPAYERWYYKDHYKKHIKNYYKARVGAELNVGIDGEYFLARRENIETKVTISEINLIYETQDYVYIDLTIGGVFIIPKNRVDHSFISEIFEIAIHHQITIIKDLNWRWK